VSGAGEIVPARPAKGAAAFRTIGEVAEALDLPAHVLRFWESKFPQLQPLKRGGGRRYYRPEDVILLRRIRQCLYQDGYTIRGVRQLLDSDGDYAARDLAPTPAPLPLFPLDAASSAASDKDSEPPAGPARAPRRPRRPAVSPERRAALEEIRRELLEVRALLDELLRRRAR
jgi:DNA-binding transcriptional MerR regulator